MSDRYIIPSLDRAFNVLALLAEEPRGLSLAELGRRSDIPKSTLFRILTTLQKHRCVVWSDEQRGYRLGARLLELGTSYLDQADLYHVAARPMETLAEECHETVFLGKLEGGQVIYLRRMESPRSITVVKKLGQRVPAHCTATGVAMLAFLPEAEVDTILDEHGMPSFNEATLTDRDALKQRLAHVRSRGYAIVDGEYNQELLCVSAPVFDHTRRPCASLTVAMLSSHATEDRTQAVAERVRQVAQTFSREMGCAVGDEV